MGFLLYVIPWNVKLIINKSNKVNLSRPKNNIKWILYFSSGYNVKQQEAYGDDPIVVIDLIGNFCSYKSSFHTKTVSLCFSIFVGGRGKKSS